MVLLVVGTGHCGLGIDFSVPICTRTESGNDPTPTAAPSPPPTAPSPPPAGGSCGGTLTGSSGTITSPGFPTGYSNNQDCKWTVSPAASGNKVVKFTVESMELEPQSECSYDYVQFLEADGSEISKICGSTLPRPFYTRGNGGIVTFRSDDNIAKQGFKLKYEFVGNPSCQGVKLRTAVAVRPVTITSPGFPSNYPANKVCDWTISVPDGQKVKLVFTEFSTEPGYNTVTVYDGGDATSSNMIKKISGHSKEAEVTSTGSKLHITFKSDTTKNLNGFRAVVYGEK